MSGERQKAIARRFEQVFETGELSGLSELAAPNYVAYVPESPDPMDLETFKRYEEPFLAAFSDRRTTIDAIIEEGDHVAFRATFRAIHTGEFQGTPATGREVAVSGFEWMRFAAGKVAEHWMVQDGMSLLRQLGALPEMEEGRE